MAVQYQGAGLLCSDPMWGKGREGGKDGRRYIHTYMYVVTEKGREGGGREGWKDGAGGRIFTN